MHVTVAVFRLILYRTGELCNRLASDTQVVQNAATVCIHREDKEFSQMSVHVSQTWCTGHLCLIIFHVFYIFLLKVGNFKLFTATKFHKFHTLKLPLYVILFLHSFARSNTWYIFMIDIMLQWLFKLKKNKGGVLDYVLGRQNSFSMQSKKCKIGSQI